MIKYRFPDKLFNDIFEYIVDNDIENFDVTIEGECVPILENGCRIGARFKPSGMSVNYYDGPKLVAPHYMNLGRVEIPSKEELLIERETIEEIINNLVEAVMDQERLQARACSLDEFEYSKEDVKKLTQQAITKIGKLRA